MKRRSIVRAYQNLRPDEDAKQRMLNHILGSSEIPPAGKDDTMKHKKMRPMMLVALIALVAAMTVTAFASEVIAGWFKQYFEKQNGESLSVEQIAYLEENEQVLAETQIHNGYELNLKSVLADGNTIYITLGVTAPDALPFDDTCIITTESIDFYNQELERPFSSTIRVLDDMDGKESTADILLELAEGNWDHGDQWTLHIEKLVTLVHDTEYEQELLNTKYAGQSNIMYSDEEAERIYQHITMAEGPWEFTIDMSKADLDELEMMTAPVTTQGCSGFKADGTLVYEEVTIKSIVIRPLSASVYAELTESRAALDITPTSDDKLLVMMKNGSCVELRPDWAAPGEAHYIAESPIVLTDVEYILLPDGTQIMAP